MEVRINAGLWPRRAMIALAAAASMIVALLWWAFAPIVDPAVAAETAVGIHKAAGTN